MRNPSGRPEHYLQGRSPRPRPHGSNRAGFFHLVPDLREGPIVGSSLDQGMSDARHLGSDGGQGLAPEILVVAILGDVTPEVIAEAVIALLDCDLGRQPEGPAQAGIAERREPGLTAELSGLMGGKIETAELQEL